MGLLRLLAVVPTGWLVLLTVVMVLVSLLPAVTAVAVAWLVGRVIDAAGAGSDGLGVVAWPLVVVGVLLTVDQVSQSLLVPYRNWIAARINGEVRQMIRRAVSARPGIEHLESQTVRDAAALPVENAYLFNMGAGAEGQLWLMTRIVGAVAAALVVARYSWLAAAMVLVLVSWQRSQLRRHYAGAIATGMVDTASDGRAATYWSDVIGTPKGAKELRLFGFGAWSVDRFVSHAQVPVHELSRVLLSAHRLHFVIFGINALAAFLPFVLLARMAVDGDLDATGLTAALGGVVAVGRVFAAMGFEAFSIEAAVPQLAAVEQLRQFHRDERAATDRDERSTAGDDCVGGTNPAVPTITFDNVTFRYPDSDRAVLDDLSLTIPAGQSVAFVGENGAGKTTMLKLLAGFYEPTGGRILIDGVDLADTDLRVWRHQLAVIFQDFTRFELSALENVSLAAPDRTDRRTVAATAARAADAHEMIDQLPAGWDTMLSRAFIDGTDLSGGQWQRIALARAMYAAKTDGSVLVLDEPTASLDVDAETELFDQLLTHAGGCTAIVVSHRFSTVRRADRIIVISNGAVAEDGTHDELHRLDGIYARLYGLQSQRFRTDASPHEERP